MERLVKGLCIDVAGKPGLIGHSRRQAPQHEAAGIPQLSHGLGQGFHLLIFDELADQRFLRVFFFLFSQFRLLRQQQARFDLQQRRCHDEELAGIIDIKSVDIRYVGVELVRNLDDRYVINIDFVLFDKIEQQIQRTFKIRYFILVFCHDSL